MAVTLFPLIFFYIPYVRPQNRSEGCKWRPQILFLKKRYIVKKSMRKFATKTCI
jgi:hypothetical protein